MSQVKGAPEGLRYGSRRCAALRSRWSPCLACARSGRSVRETMPTQIW